MTDKNSNPKKNDAAEDRAVKKATPDKKEASKLKPVRPGDTGNGFKYFLIGAGVVAIAVVAVLVAIMGRGGGGSPVEGPRGLAADAGYVYTPEQKPAEEPKHTVVKYVDLQCPGCAELERKTSYELNRLADEGKIKVEYRVVSFLDKASTNKYSSRAANAVASVYEQDPAKAADMVSLLLASQPKEGGPGHTNDVLNYYAKSLGVENTKASIDSGKWNDWVAYVTATADLKHTPTVLVDGKEVDTSNQDPLEAIKKALDEK